MFPVFCRPAGLGRAIGGDGGITDALVAAWTFEDDLQYGDMVPDQVGGHTLSNSGTVFFAPGWVGRAAQFDVENGSLSCSTTTALEFQTGGITVSLIVRVANLRSQRFLQKGVSGAVEYGLAAVAEDGVLLVSLYVGTYRTGITLFEPVADTYLLVGRAAVSGQMLMLVKSLTTGASYEASGTIGTFPTETAGVLRLGDASRDLSGVMLDAAHIWKRLLTDEEINTYLYNGGAGGEYPFTSAVRGVVTESLAVAWTFEDAPGSLTALDVIGGNVLTLYGAAALGAGWVGNALCFSDRSAYAGRPALPLGTTDCTFAFIVSLASTEASTILSQGLSGTFEYRVCLNAYQQLEASVGDGTIALDLPAEVPTAFLVVVRIGTNGRLELVVQSLSTGVLSAQSVNGVVRSTVADSELWVGDATESPQGGFVDALHYWHRWLSNSEIAESLYNAGAGDEYPFEA